MPITTDALYIDGVLVPADSPIPNDGRFHHIALSRDVEATDEPVSQLLALPTDEYRVGGVSFDARAGLEHGWVQRITDDE